MEDTITLIVSDETYEKTAAETARPIDENRQMIARSGEIRVSVVEPIVDKAVGICASRKNNLRIVRTNHHCA
jgi:hypothetical protein